MAELESASVDTSLDNQDDPLQEYSDEDLYKLLDITFRANEELKMENIMLEKYLRRVEPKTGTNITFGGNQSMFQTDSGNVGINRVGRKRSKSRSSASERIMKLSAEQKSDIAQKEIEELKLEIERLKVESEKVFDNYKAIIDEADIRINEIRKATYEFDRDVVKSNSNTKSHQIVGEKVLRFFEDQLRTREALIEKLRLRNSTVKTQRKKLQLQLKQKEEMGEVLNVVDFEQLKIENNQYLEKIDEKNQELLRLKLMAGNTLQVLNSFKKKLNKLETETARLKEEITNRVDSKRRLDSEKALVEEEKTKADALKERFVEQLTDYKVPKVMEYVVSNATLYELKKKENIWNRKVDIAKMGVDRHKKMWQELRQASLGTF